MLVLSRRPDESIVFPNLGVTIRLLNIRPGVARIGVDAPAEFAILRGELLTETPQPTPTIQAMSRELRNQLGRATLALQLSRQQRELGRDSDADATLEQAVALLAELDRDWSQNSLSNPARGRKPSCRALVVDDDINQRSLLAGVLGMNGCECETAGNGDEALARLAERGNPDVVLLDMWMPGRSGPETLSAIRQDARWSSLKVFAVSGTSPEELGIRCGPGGLDAWFPKPLDPIQLCEAIHRAVASPN